MKPTYSVTVPPTEIGKTTIIVYPNRTKTVSQEALSHYNMIRRTEGLPPISRMPNGTKYKKLKSPKYDLRQDRSKTCMSIIEPIRINKFKINWKSGSGIPYSQTVPATNKDDAVTEWKKSWKHIPKRQITSITEV